MQINKFELENFGAFKDRISFDLQTSDKQPIVLFGGNNGSGKTTFFEGIKLCLYGISFKGTRLTLPEYKHYLRSRLNKQASSEKMYLGLEFVQSHTGLTNTYFVKRTWTFSKDKESPLETVEVYCNNKLVEDVGKDIWQEFVTDLIPPGITNLFFFDGENIQNLAIKDNPLYLKEAFHSLVGLDIIDKLNSDINILFKLKAAKSKDKELKSELLALERTKEQLELEIDAFTQRLAQTQSELDRLSSTIEKQERKLASEGGSFSTKLSQVKAKLTSVNSEIELTEKQIRDLAEDLLPFSVSPKFCALLKKRLENEEKLVYEKILKTAITKNNKDLVNSAASSAEWKSLGIDKRNTEKIISLVLNALTTNNSDAILVHEMTADQSRALLHEISQALTTLPAAAKQLNNRLELLFRERTALENQVTKAPSEEAIAPLIKDLNGLHVQKGKFTERAKLLEERVRVLRNEFAEISRKIEKLLEVVKSDKHLSTKLDLAKRVQSLLAEYSEKVKEEKIDEFSKNFLDNFNHLSRKGAFVDKVKIDKNTFAIDLYDKNASLLHRNLLAAGEQQIYAISLLWALAACSKRQLPFVIDTPLGRLDSVHRKNLVEKFFPKVGSQVILFSTDMEVDKDHYSYLAPTLSKTYRLEYDTKKSATTVYEDYFWGAKN